MPWLFKSIEFGNVGTMSDKKLVTFEFKISPEQNGRNKL